MNTTTLNPQDIVTSIIVHEVEPGAAGQYETWLADIRVACSRFPGYLSTDVIRPVGKSREYATIVRFADFKSLNAWMESDERRQHIARMQSSLRQGDRYEIRTGLDFWFTPKHAPVKVPTAWKQWLVTWSAILPLSIVVGANARPSGLRARLVCRQGRRFGGNRVPDGLRGDATLYPACGALAVQVRALTV
ncbi:antibiotic biosynthesis monooxygenase [Cupriavidus metallidurans]|uniref:antibiotic biosynthesis monooxygenase n=1 Tax=Cupriavidus metallidurans TaxID=119219 RepID=UPI003D07D128